MHRPPGGRSARAALAALLAGLALPAAGTEPELGADLAALLEHAARHNPEYAAMRHEAAAGGARAEAEGALPDPRLRVELRDLTKGGSQGVALLPNEVGSTRYQLMQELPWFGKRELARGAAREQAAAAEARARAAWAELAARIKTTHARRHASAEALRIGRANLDLLARLERIAQVRYASGLAAQQDVIRAQTEQTALRGELVALESERRRLDARLNALLARPADTPLSGPERGRPGPARIDAAELARRLRARNPELEAAAARMRAAEAERALARKARYPDLALGLAPIQTGNAVREWELMLELNLPWQAPRRAREREAAAMLDAARARIEAEANTRLAELSEQLAGLAAARENEALTADQLLPQAELTYQAALTGYETGRVDFATLLEAQRQIRQARLARVNAGAEADERLAEIERLLGEAP